MEGDGKVLGVVGFGRIGQAVARRGARVDMKVIYYSRSRLDPTRERDLNVGFMPFDELLGEADFVSLHVPMSHLTRHLIGSRELDIMRFAFLMPDQYGSRRSGGMKKRLSRPCKTGVLAGQASCLRK